MLRKPKNDKAVVRYLDPISASELPRSGHAHNRSLHFDRQKTATDWPDSTDQGVGRSLCIQLLPLCNQCRLCAFSPKFQTHPTRLCGAGGKARGDAELSEILLGCLRVSATPRDKFQTAIPNPHSSQASGFFPPLYRQCRATFRQIRTDATGTRNTNTAVP